MSHQPPLGRGSAIGHEEAEQGVACAFCGGRETELHSLFGNMQLASQYYCHGCHSIFEVIAWRDRGEGRSGSSPSDDDPLP